MTGKRNQTAGYNLSGCFYVLKPEFIITLFCIDLIKKSV